MDIMGFIVREFFKNVRIGVRKWEIFLKYRSNSRWIVNIREIQSTIIRPATSTFDGE